MLQHIRSTFWLLILTAILCSVVYPFTLWAIGRAPFFRNRAEGSLLTDGEGNAPVGSLLIAQPFSNDKYFQPRPSAASYNGAASGASNWGASNPLLRDRVARQLGIMVKFKSGPMAGTKVGESIEKWFVEKTAKNPHYLETWASEHPLVAQNWAKSVELAKVPEIVADWRNDHPNSAAEPTSEELLRPFLKRFAAIHPGSWPSIEEETAADGTKKKVVKHIMKGSDIQAGFFDAWLQDNPTVDLELIPADMVMQSGSGLDPHITLKNAVYQLDDHVADAWAKEKNISPVDARKKIDELLRQRAFRPLGGLAGEPLVNVLEVNLLIEGLLKPTR